MTNSTSFAAQLLESSREGYSALAAERLLVRHPEVAERYGIGAQRRWRQYFAERLRELAAALAAASPGMFAAEVLWAQKTFRARDAAESDLVHGLECLRAVLEEEMPGSLAPLACAYVDEARDALAETADGEASADEEPLVASGPSGELALTYLESLLRGDVKAGAQSVLEAVEKGLSIRAAYLEVLMPAQREVGRLWHESKLSIAQEHLVTETTRSLVAQLRNGAYATPANGKTVITATPSRNAHDLPVRVLADLFDMAGWKAVHLGGDVPAEPLAEAAEGCAADLIALSVARVAQLVRAREAVKAVREIAPEVKILVGGRAFLHAPDYWRRLGADGYAATLDAAVAEGERLVGLE